MEKEIRSLITEWFRFRNPDISDVKVTEYGVTDEGVLVIKVYVVTTHEAHVVGHELKMEVLERSIFPQDPSRYPQTLIRTDRTEDEKYVGRRFNWDCWYPEPAPRGNQLRRVEEIIDRLNDMAYELI